MIGLVRVLNVQFGPDATLSIHTATVNFHLFGAFENGETDRPWRLPNVFGVAKEKQLQPASTAG